MVESSQEIMDKSGKEMLCIFFSLFLPLELINEGEESLIISNVEASCHCTLPSWSKSPIELNEKGIINVEYHGDRTGYFQEDVLVYCNVKYSPLLLTLEGEVINVDNQ